MKDRPPRRAVRRSRMLVAGVALLTVVGIGLFAHPGPAWAQENVALNKPASGSAPCNADEAPAKAVNGSVSGGNSDKFCSLVPGPKFLQVDLGQTFGVSSFVIRHAGAGGEDTGWNTRDFTIQVSANGTNFTTVVTVSANTTSVTTHNVTAGNVRFVRLNITTPTSTGDGAARIYEFEVHSAGTPPPPPPPPPGPGGNIALNKPTITTGSCNSDESGDKAVNGSISGGNTDKFCSGSRPSFLMVDLQSSATVDRVVVRHAGAGGENPVWNTRDFTIETSVDGTTLATVATVTGNTAAVTTHTFSPRTARFVRISITTPTSDADGATRIYEFEVYGTPGAPPPPPPPPPQPGPCAAEAPPTLNDYVSNHVIPMTRVFCNADIAVYHDQDLLALPPSQTAWASAFAADVWVHYRETYGSCSVNRPLPPPMGPNCTRFGYPKPLIAFFHQNKFGGGTVNNRFDSWTGWRNTIDVGDNGWSVNNGTLRDVIAHEACHIVEGAAQGVHESPAFGEIWGDSKWAEICMYDFYRRTGRTADAQRAFNQFMNNRDGLPQGANQAAWFRDWFHPLYLETGSNMAFMDRFFGLLNQYFPKHLENNNMNFVYDRRMNAGEFVHFMSGAVGRNLSGMAAQAFNTGFSMAQFNQARAQFPQITY